MMASLKNKVDFRTTSILESFSASDQLLKMVEDFVHWTGFDSLAVAYGRDHS